MKKSDGWVPTEFDKKLIRLAMSGLIMEGIAKELNCSESSLQTKLHRWRLPLTKIRVLNRQGKTEEEIFAMVDPIVQKSYHKNAASVLMPIDNSALLTEIILLRKAIEKLTNVFEKESA